MKKLLVRKEGCLYWCKGGVLVEGESLPPGLSGDCTYLSGDLDDCEISDKERESGVEISALVGTEPSNG